MIQGLTQFRNYDDLEHHEKQVKEYEPKVDELKMKTEDVTLKVSFLLKILKFNMARSLKWTSREIL